MMLAPKIYQTVFLKIATISILITLEVSCGSGRVLLDVVKPAIGIQNLFLVSQ